MCYPSSKGKWQIASRLFRKSEAFEIILNACFVSTCDDINKINYSYTPCMLRERVNNRVNSNYVGLVIRT